MIGLANKFPEEKYNQITKYCEDIDDLMWMLKRSR